MRSDGRTPEASAVATLTMVRAMKACSRARMMSTSSRAMAAAASPSSAGEDRFQASSISVIVPLP